MNQLLLADKLLAAGAAVAGYTTRFLGSDYQKLSVVLNKPLCTISSLKQIHSPNVIEVTSPIGQELVEGDALITAKADMVIGVRVADCLPILVYDKQSGYKAAIHAGWKGLVGGVIENTVTLLKQKGVFLNNCVVSLGPSICEHCFEVGPEVKEAFYNKFGDDTMATKGHGDRSYISLKKAAIRILSVAGVLPEAIESHLSCTYCQNELWPSFRRGDKFLRSFCYIG